MLAITPLVVPLLVGFRGAAGLLARGDAALARALLGVDASPPISSGGRWFWGRARRVLADATLLAAAGLPRAAHDGSASRSPSASVALIGGALQAIALPDLVPLVGRGHRLVARRHARPGARSSSPAGVVALLVGVHLLGPLATLWRRLVAALLAARPSRAPAGPVSRTARRRALALRRRASRSSIVALVTVVWALTGGGYFWPEWVMLPLALVARDPRLGRARRGAAAVRRGPVVTRALAIHAGVLAALFALRDRRSGR